MLKSSSKVVVLSQREIALVYAIVKLSEIRIPRKTETHMILAAKIIKAKEMTKDGQNCTLYFGLAECSLMRQYNTTYCAHLSDNVKEFGLKGNDLMSEEGLEVYRAATKIHRRFSVMNN
jgi:hypothetical protein